jgi:hypothetical protein
LKKHEELKMPVLANEFFANAKDPDNAVRTMASNIRKRLEECYASDGQMQKYRIKLPPGSYIPTFEVVEPSTGEAPLDPPLPESIKPTWKVKVAAGFILGLVIGLALGFLIGRRIPTQGPQEPVQAGLAPDSRRFHYIDIDKNTDITLIHYGTVVRGRTVVKDNEQLYLLVMDSSDLKYYTQLDHEGNAPLKLCPDGSWERQVWPGTPTAGDDEIFTLVVVKTNQQLPKEFVKEYLPNGSELKRLRVRRVPPIRNETYIFKCG